MMTERKTDPVVNGGAARFTGGNSSVQVSVIREEIEPGVVLTIGTGVLTPEERKELERRRLLAQEEQRRQVAPAGGSGPQILAPLHYSGKSHTIPEPPKLTAKQKRELAEQEAAKQQEQAAVAVYNARKLAEEQAQQQALQAIQHEQAEVAAEAQTERLKAMWGDNGGAVVLGRSQSPSFKGDR